MISVCIIAKNEQDFLPMAVNSVAGLADHIFVGDTGSTDDTVKVARELGCTVLEGLNAMHKGESRNAVINAAPDGWIVILDCDEKVADPEGVRDFLLKTEAQALYVRIHFGTTEKSSLSYSQMRIWQKGTFLYRYRAHEVPIAQVADPKIKLTEFVWEHNPPSERAGWKLDYTLQRLLLDLKENPGSSRVLYYLGRQYAYMQQWQNAVDILTKYLEKPDINEADACFFLAQAYGQLDKEREQIQSLYRACAVNPARRDWWCMLAEVYYAGKHYGLAEVVLAAASKIGEPKVQYTYARWYGSAFHDLYSRVLYKLGKYEEGLVHANRAVELDPGDARLQLNVQWFLYHLGDEDAAYILFGPDVHKDQPRHKILAEHVVGPDVLDFGCGTGDLLLLLQDKFRTAGVDKSQYALLLAKQRGVKSELYSEWPFQVYDTVICSQVLEHLDDPGAWVTEASAHLREKGTLLVTVPLDGKVASPGHKAVFTEASLCELLERIGKVEIVAWEDPNRIFAKVTNG